MGDNQGFTLDRIKAELTSLARYVDQSRQGVDSLESAVKIGSEKFPEASNQLSSVTGDLENAANNIMSIVEGLLVEHDRMSALLESFSKWVGSVRNEDADRGAIMLKELTDVNVGMKSNIMEIFSNLSFHDLSGQKLKKVIGTLAAVEAKILEMAINFGFMGERENGDKLLNKLRETSESQPINQAVVDRILNELGA